MKKLLAVLVVTAAVNATAAVPTPTGLWMFNDTSNLGKATIGTDLVLAGSHTAVAGVFAGDGAVLDPLGAGNYLNVSHGIAPNGGGVYVNEWTVAMDISLPASSLGQWVSLFQTAIGNNNDGDCFIATDETIGVFDTGYSTSALTGETWYRLAVSVDNGSFYRIYVNGTKWLEGTPQPVDGRFSLDPQILMFADNDGDDFPINCSNLAIWGSGLSDADILSLGDPLTPVAVPEPGTLGFIALGGLVCLLRRGGK